MISRSALRGVAALFLLAMAGFPAASCGSSTNNPSPSSGAESGGSDAAASSGAMSGSGAATSGATGGSGSTSGSAGGEGGASGASSGSSAGSSSGAASGSAGDAGCTKAASDAGTCDPCATNPLLSCPIPGAGCVPFDNSKVPTNLPAL